MKNIPAFPSKKKIKTCTAYEETVYIEGMSLRDYFAVRAPIPPKWWIDCYGKNLNDLQSEAELISAWNYSYSDAMLKEREK